MKHLIPEFDRLRERYPADFTPSLVLPCLHRIQEDRGYITESDIVDLAAYLHVPRIQIDEDLSFYTMFRRKPVGRWHIEVCRNVSCSMNGAERLLERLCRKLDISPGATTPDGRFTLSTVECLGSCGTAPVMAVNGKYYESVDPEKLDLLLEGMP